MKGAWADLKNQNKHSFIDKKKHEDGVTAIIKLACDEDIVAVVEYSASFSESDHSTEQETLAATSDFNHPSEDYVNYISTDLLAQIMSTQNDGQNNGR